MNSPKLRRSEWVILCFFAYIALISPLFSGRPKLELQPYFLLAAVVLFFGLLSVPGTTSRLNWALDFARDWAPFAFTLIAFREMELFIPAIFLHTYEGIWHTFDHHLLVDAGVRSAIEAPGVLLPLYLEFCYLLVYGVGIFCVAVLYGLQLRRRVDPFFFVYLLGTLGAYALFPYFPSQPPRVLYPQADLPQIVTLLRTFNLWILKEGTIHSSVFPSAHVSSAFSCAWAMFLCLPQRKRYGWGLLAYAISVSVATVYGRYHYTADVAAGLFVSLIAGVIGLIVKRHLSDPYSQERSSTNGVVRY